MAHGADLSDIIERLHPRVVEARRALLTGPVDADGDSVGASLAMATVLRHVNPTLEVVVVSGSPIPERYRFLDGADAIVAPDALRGTFDLALLLDGVRHRIGDVGAFFDAAGTRVLIDHHWSSSPDEYDLALLDVKRASTCEIVFDVASHPRFQCPVDDIMATQLYTGIAFDTGTFRYSCTTPDTMRLAARLLETGIDAQRIIERVFLDSRYRDIRFRGRVMATIERSEDGRIAHAAIPTALVEDSGAGPEGTEGLINALVFIIGVEVAALFVEKPDGQVKVSFRSRGGVNVAQLARDLSPLGGGHDRASGVTLGGSLDQVRTAVLTRLQPMMP
jgi:bifunctional oligoribonuclease and PAP phosphatase NrnA